MSIPPHPVPLRVLLDGRYVGDEPTGIGWYTLHLARALAEIGVECDLLGPSPVATRRLLDAELPAALRLVEEAAPVSSLRGYQRMRAHLRRAEGALYHCPYLPFPLRAGGRATVVTIHDLIPLLSPDWVRGTRQGRHLGLLRFWLGRAVAVADAVITVSDCTGRDLARLFPAAAPKVRVVPNGFRAPAELTESEVAERLRRLGVSPPYFLSVGRRVPYKRLDLLVRAFAAAAPEIDGSLVLVTPRDPRFRQVEEAVSTACLGERIRLLDYAQEGELNALYRGARLLVHPSLYEGFGLPVLEAMAHGLPVLACRAGAVTEVAGEAARYFEPDDLDGLRRGLIELWRDEAARAGLASAGRGRAAGFSWRNTAEATARVYREVLSTRG